MEFIEGEAPAFTLTQMIYDLMELCYYDGARGATKWCPATEGMMKELIEDIETICKEVGVSAYIH